MGALVLLIIVGTIVACAATHSGDQKTPQKPHSRSKGKQVIIRKNGQQKHYKINQYGEIFED